MPFKVKTLLLVGLALAGFVFALLDTASLGRSALMEENPFMGKEPLFASLLPQAREKLMERAGAAGFFQLEEGDLFKLFHHEKAGFQYNELSFAVRLEPGDLLEVQFRASVAAAYLLRLSRDPDLPSALLIRQGQNRMDRLLPLGKGSALMGGDWISCRLGLSGPDFSLRMGTGAAVTFTDVRLSSGAVVFSAVQGRPGLDNVAFEALDRGKTVILRETFEGAGPAILRHGAGRAWAAFCLWTLFACALAFWISLPGGLPILQALKEIFFLFMAALPVALLGEKGLADFPRGTAGGAVFCLCLIWCMLRIPRLRFRKGAGDLSSSRGGAAPVGKFPVSSVLAFLALALLLFGATAPSLTGRIPWKVGGPARAEAGGLTGAEVDGLTGAEVDGLTGAEVDGTAGAEAGGPAGAEADGPDRTPALILAGPLPLDLANQWTTQPRSFRDFTLTGEVRLEEDSLAEIHFRKQENLDWNGLQLSTLEGTGCRWLSVTPLRFDRFEDSAVEALPPGEWVSFSLEVRGATLKAVVKGRALPALRDGSRAQGPLSMLVYQGKGGLRNLKLTAHAPLAEALPISVLAGQALWQAGLLFLAALLFWGVLSLAGPLPANRSAWMECLVHLPLMAGSLALSLGLVPGYWPLAGGAAMTLLGRLALVGANRVRLKKGHLVPAMILPCAAALFAFWALTPPRSLTHQVNNLRLYAFTQPVTKDLLWYQLPKLRRSNFYLRDHGFRGKHRALEKEDGTFRIVCMGGSSTFGHLMPFGSGWDFPAILEKRLQARHDRRSFEVLNAGIRGGNSLGVNAFYRGVIRHFKPDLLILNLFYNDAYVQTLMDEAAYLRKLEEAAFKPGMADRLMEEISLFRRSRLFTQYAERERQGEPYPQAFFHSGVESFRFFIRAVVAAALEDGVAVLLVKEPFNQGRGLLNCEAYYSALDQVGREMGVPVCEPLNNFQARFESLAPLYMDAVHFTREGNRIMGAFLAEECERLGLLGK